MTKDEQLNFVVAALRSMGVPETFCTRNHAKTLISVVISTNAILDSKLEADA